MWTTAWRLVLSLVTLLHPQSRSLVYPSKVLLAWTENSRSLSVRWFTDIPVPQYLRYREVCFNYSPAPWVEVQADSDSYSRCPGLRRESRHTAFVRNLLPHCSYEYQVGEGVLWSDIKKIRGWTQTNAREFVRVLVLGDLGLSPYSEITKDAIREYASTHQVDGLIHMGDIAYSLEEYCGFGGDQYLDSMQGIADTLPYMVCPGNHEAPGNFTHYKERFRMPENRANQGSNLFYSFDLGKAHFVVLSTEVWAYQSLEAAQTQADWLASDLRQATTHTTPWLFTFGHKPMYCGVDWTRPLHKYKCNINCWAEASIVRRHLEPVFTQHNVDIYFSGHVHRYERQSPIRNNVTVPSERDEDHAHFNPRAPLHIVSGSGGNNHGPNDITPTPQLWSRAQYTASGFGVLTVFNSSHVLWEQFDSAQVTEVDFCAADAESILRSLRTARHLRTITVRGTLALSEVAQLREVVSGATLLQGLSLHSTGVDFQDLRELVQRPLLRVCLHMEPLFRRSFSDWEATFSGLNTLALSECGFTKPECGKLAAVLARCPQLQELSLAGNCLGQGTAELLQPLSALRLKKISLARTRLPTSLAVRVLDSLSQSPLAHLDLANNALSDAIVSPIASSWLTTLTHLLLSHNCLSSVLPLCSRKLELLDISYNSLTVAGSASEVRCRGVKTATLSGEERSLDASWSSVILREVSRLRAVNLSCAAVSPDSWSSLSRCADLERIDLTCSSVPPPLAPALVCKPRLTHLRLASNSLDAHTMRDVVAALRGCPLESVDFSSNAYTGEGLEGLTSTQIRYLALCSNPLSQWSALKNLLSAQRSLQELNLSRTGLNSHELAAIADALARLPLQSLCLSGNDLSAARSARLPQFPTLQSMDLAHCRITAESVSWLSALFPKCLRRLSLFCNPLGPLSVLPLPEALVSLNLHKCDLRDSGLLRLRPPGALRELRLGWNSVTAASMPEFAGTLRSLCKLEYISLFEAILDDDRVECLIEALPASLQRLDLGYTHLSPTATMQLLAHFPPRLVWCNLVGMTLDTEVLQAAALYSFPSIIVNK